MLLPIEDATQSPLRRLGHLSQIPVTVLITLEPALDRNPNGTTTYWLAITTNQRPDWLLTPTIKCLFST